MKLKVAHIDPKHWVAHCAGPAHKAAFGVVRDPAMERIDGAFLVLDEEKDEPVGYVTYRAVNAELCNWKFGGAFSNIGKTVVVQRGLKMLFEATAMQGFKEIVTLIANRNLPSLKLHLANGFVIIGVKHINGDTLVELHKRLEV